MDAFLFLKEWKRMCDTLKSCSVCPLGFLPDCAVDSRERPKKTVETVKKWSHENPVKTMMMDFFEKFPNAPKDDEGEPCCCPYDCGYVKSKPCPDDDNCLRCWSRPLEESK